VGGSAVKNPQVLKVRIGTRLQDVFEQCGGLVGRAERIAIGSPLKGRMVLDIDEPIVKTSYAVSAMLEKQIGGTVTRSCIDCGECRGVCPVGFDPEELFKQIKAAQDAKNKSAGGSTTTGISASSNFATGCHGCGCCEVVCPSRLPLSTVIHNAGKRGKV
jgi:electron transport complex protein RnfC